jgi:hypothetical protein
MTIAVSNINPLAQPPPLLPGMPIVLAAKTYKAKSRLREAGTDVWIIKRIQREVFCLNCAPGMLIEPQGKSKLRCWIKFPFDPDFDILGPAAN